MASKFMMSEQSKKRPLGVTLLGYLFLLTAVGQIHMLIKGTIPFDTFLGFLAPTPLPHIEFGIKLILFVVLGIGLLRMDAWSRLLLIATLYLSLATTLTGAVFGLLNRGREEQINEMFPGVVDSQANMIWVIQLIIAGGVLLLLLIYAYRLKAAFNRPQVPEEDRTPTDERTIDEPHE
ncbi:hypothetical protein KQI63_11795 [bacterium]|nr:hypothetical protein [bacterium]